MSIEHGGNLQQATAMFGQPMQGWIDLSTGINPTPYPLPNEMLTQTEPWHRLPEAGRLEEIAAHYYSTSQLLALPGSQAAISLLPALRQPSRVAIAQPEYLEHALAWQRWGHKVERLSAATISKGPSPQSEYDVLVMSNPNNPTGKHYSPELLLAWHASLLSRDGWLVVDEAFSDTCPHVSLVFQAGERGLIILRSLGKFFGLAGARVGFLLSSAELRQRMSELLGPWPLTGPSRLAGAMALADITWQRRQMKALQQASERLSRILSQAGLKVSGKTSLYCWAPTQAAEATHHALASAGIWVRAWDTPPGLRFGLPADEQAWSRLRDTLARLKSG